MSFTQGYTVNANTQYAFTVSNETIDEIVQGGGITEQDIADYCYTALIDNRINRLIAADTADPLNFSSAAAIRSWSKEHTPYYFGEPEYVISNTDLNGESDTVYERNFLIWNGTIYPNTDNEKTGTFLVMDIADIKRWYINYDTNMFYETELESTSTREGGTFTGYNGTAYSYNSNVITGNPEFKCDNNDPLLNPDTNMSVCNVLVINNELWIGQLNPSNKGENEILYAYSIYANYISPTLRGYLDNTTTELPTYYQKGTINFAGIPYVQNMNYPEISGESFTFHSYAETNNDYIIDVSGRYGGDWHVETGGVLCKTLNALKNWMSWCGLKFKYDDTLYKPIIEQGVIVGFTDNMSTPSEYDNMTNVTGNNITPTPPTPPMPDAQDNEIDVNMQQFSPTQCFVNYIEMSTENMIKLASGFNAYNASIWNIGGDLMKNLISYKIFAVYGTHSGTIKNVSIGGHEIEYNSAPISGNYIDDMGTVDLGSIEIGSKFRFNDWRDYAPYTKIECFVPCCGWCQLPPWCMGRTITGTLYIDIANGSCKAVIKAGRTPVAEIGGCVAMDVPFSSVATGAKAAGIITAITNGAVSAFNPTPQNLISGSFGILSSLNANYTETKGVMGDGSNINGCTDFLIKVTRPASTDTGNGEITDRYKHEKGIPCAKTKTLASGQGFTQITDANIDGAMTDREKQMIIDGFRHGLIL